MRFRQYKVLKALRDISDEKPSNKAYTEDGNPIFIGVANIEDKLKTKDKKSKFSIDIITTELNDLNFLGYVKAHNEQYSENILKICITRKGKVAVNDYISDMIMGLLRNSIIPAIVSIIISIVVAYTVSFLTK